MIVSHRHRYIFVRTRKTAGTSVEIALSKFCGPDDIITRDADDALRTELGYPGPQNDGHIPLSHYKASEWIKLLLRRQRAHFRNHAPAERVRRHVGEAVWNSYYKFTIERDPWDKAISLYSWRTRDQQPRPTLLQFLRRVDAKSLSNAHIYLIDDALAVDRVIRFDRLDDELEEVRQRVGLPEPLTMPRAKTMHRVERTHYSASIGPAERAIIDRCCRREIELLGYRFEDRRPG
ncbi:MAG: sulfotransferase family 2 domain-containing protein [Rubrivivax sp.]